MNDFFKSWVAMQKQVLNAQTEQLKAATKAMGIGDHFDGAIKAAQDIHDSQVKAWESWLAMWGNKGK